MNQLSQDNNCEWNVDGLDPVPWPGENYELLCDTPGFSTPDSAAEFLNSNSDKTSSWELEINERANVENIYTLTQENSPWKVRARLAGSGAHPDADSVDYVLEVVVLLGTQDNGSYQSVEMARGTLSEIAEQQAKLSSAIEEAFSEHCKFKTDHPIVSSLVELKQVMSKAK